MYDELVKMLRTCALIHGQCAVCYYHGNPCNALTEIPLAQAADAMNYAYIRVSSWAKEEEQDNE